MTTFTESVVEDAALTWLEALGYAVRHGPDIASGEAKAERTDPNYRDLTTQHYKPLLAAAKLPISGCTPCATPSPPWPCWPGVPTKVVSEQLGHASAAFTLDVYSHVLPALQREAADAMDRLLCPASSS